MNISGKKSAISEFRALGTDVFLEIVLDVPDQKKKAEQDLAAARNIFYAKEKIFSRFDPKSELSRLNEELSKWQKASSGMVYLAKRALYYNKKSGGLYDPRVIEILEKIGYQKDFRQNDFSKIKIPDRFEKLEKDLSEDLRVEEEKIFFSRRMDFSGIAKGCIVDQVAEFLREHGWKNFLVDAGGDMSIAGLNSEGAGWRIAVEGISEEKIMLEISERGIATSGISRKKWRAAGRNLHHLVNPKDPSNFSYELKTVSVIAENTEEADGRAKTLVLMGKERGFEFAKKNKIAAVFLDCKGNILVSPEAKKYILK